MQASEEEEGTLGISDMSYRKSYPKHKWALGNITAGKFEYTLIVKQLYRALHNQRQCTTVPHFTFLFNKSGFSLQRLWVDHIKENFIMIGQTITYPGGMASSQS